MSTPYLHWPPGFRREGPVWVDQDGNPVEGAELERLTKLAIPPAWTHVWAADDPNERVQARGLDSRGRIQYRYSREATEQAAVQKYAHMLHYAEQLPKLRQVTLKQLSRRPKEPDLDQLTALVARFLDLGMFRVGTEKYVRENHTYGLTTLEGRHVQVDGNRISFDFIGKEHLRQEHSVQDPPAARVTRKLLARTPAEQPLFQVEGPPVRRVHAATVNSFIHAASGSAATAKVARTWGGTVIATAVAAGARFDGQVKHRDPDLVAYDAAAAALGNTPSMARKSYVHPGAVEVGRRPAVRDALARSIEQIGTDRVEAVFKDQAFQAAVLAELRSNPT